MTAFTGVKRIREVEVAKCPVCGKPIIADLDLDITFGPFEFAQEEGAPARRIDVTVSAHPSVVGARIEHYCSRREEPTDD